MSNINHNTGEVRLDEFGREIPDPTPVELPVGFKQQETIAQMVARLVRKDVSEYAARNDQETFDEADDFTLDEEDFDPHTPYEESFDPTLGRDITPADFKDPEKRIHLRNLYLEAEKNKMRAEARQEAIDEAYRLAKHEKTLRRAQERGAGVSPAAAHAGAKPPPCQASN